MKTTESGGVCRYDAGKKIKGRKRHILTGTCGFLAFILVHAADIQDRDGAVDVLKAIRRRFPWLRHVFAEGGYAGQKLRDAIACHGDWTTGVWLRKLGWLVALSKAERDAVAALPFMTEQAAPIAILFASIRQ